MSVPEPDEPDRCSGPGGRDGTDAAFAEIVAGLRAESQLPEWPAGEPNPDVSDNAAEQDRERVEHAEDDHFQPPEPPPLPTLRARTVAGLVALAFGALLLLAPTLLGLAVSTGRLLGILAVAGAIGWLLAGLHDGPPADSGWDDGARL